MSIEDARSARDRFLTTLQSGDADALERIVDDRFTFSDLQGRMQISGVDLVALVRDGRLSFDRIELVEEQAHEQKDGTVRFQELFELSGGIDSVRYNGRFRIIEVFGPSPAGWTARLAAAAPSA